MIPRGRNTPIRVITIIICTPITTITTTINQMRTLPHRCPVNKLFLSTRCVQAQHNLKAWREHPPRIITTTMLHHTTIIIHPRLRFPLYLPKNHPLSYAQKQCSRTSRNCHATTSDPVSTAHVSLCHLHPTISMPPSNSSRSRNPSHDLMANRIAPLQSAYHATT